jgi:purine-cytosine permease-like protein
MVDEALERREQARRETGASLMFIGLAVWVADLLVVFFLPAGMKLGRQTMFLSIIVALALLGIVLMIGGYFMRGKPDE